MQASLKPLQLDSQMANMKGGSKPCQVEWAAGAAGREATEQSSSTGSVKGIKKKWERVKQKFCFGFLFCFFV